MNGSGGRARTMSAAAGVLALALMLGGCMQLDTRVKLNEDGSATVTERLLFSRRLLDLAEEERKELLALLSKESAQRRMAHMGEGVQLVSHDVHDAEGAARESVAVYQVDQIDKFEYVSPWLDLTDYSTNNVLKFQTEPLYTCGSSGGQAWAGTIRINVRTAKPAKRKNWSKDPKVNPDIPPAPKPVDQQLFRELAPIMRDLLSDFQVKLTFEAYCPLVPHAGSPAIRDLSAGATAVDLLNFTSKDLDSYGGKFLDNEEIMLELVQMDFGGENTAEHLKSYGSNTTLPVFMARNHGGCGIFVRPSKPLFDKYFAGKNITFQPWTKDPPFPATFEKIGYHPRATAETKKQGKEAAPTPETPAPAEAK